MGFFLGMVKNALLPIMVLNHNDEIVAFNDYLKKFSKGKVREGLHVNEVFQKWMKNEQIDLFFSEIAGKKIAFIQSPIDDSNFILLIGLNTTTFEHLIVEKERLEELNKDLAAAFENSYDGIYITDSEGITLRTNPAIERLTGIPKDYYIGKNVDNLISRGILKASVTHLVREKRRTASVVQKNYVGKEVLLTGTPLFNEKGEVEKVVTNIRDLSKLNELLAELRKMKKLNEVYKKELSLLKDNSPYVQGAIVNSEKMREIYETAERIANVDATILISGETGVGKDVLAKFIYEKSFRSNSGEYIKVNCGAIPGDLLESEMFGYEAGAFTGADPKGKAGLFEVADGGVLFLDEIGELPVSLQVKLLRVLQESEIQRIGGVKSRKVNVRIIAATNRNLKEMVKNGEFREDLFYRLNVIPLTIPPLRKRRDDILPLTHYFLNEINKKYNMKKSFSNELQNFLYAYDWPGNVRELFNLIERMVVTTVEDKIERQNLPVEYVEDANNTNFTVTNKVLPLKKAVELTEENMLLLAAEQCKSTYEVAELLEISQPTVVRRMKKYGINFD